MTVARINIRGFAPTLVPLRWVPCALVALLVSSVFLLGSMREPDAQLLIESRLSTPVARDTANKIGPLSNIRVQIGSDFAEARFRSRGEVTVTSDEGRFVIPPSTGEWVPIAMIDRSRLRVGSKTLQSNWLELRAATTDTIEFGHQDRGNWSLSHEYPGSVHVVVPRIGPSQAINHVPIEAYVGSVVANEVWPGFSDEALRAQAIIARSYALYQCDVRGDKLYDVKATQSSQVYRGLRLDELGSRANAAAYATRGLVCVHGQSDSKGKRSLFPTYYSACCGGSTQSEEVFGVTKAISPLRGSVACDHCRIAPSDSYRWGPVKIPLTKALQQLQSRCNSLSSFNRIEDIVVSKWTKGGRPLELRVTDQSGRSETIVAYHLRAAFGVRSVPSSWCDIRVDGSFLILTNGRGHGHGVGLCQWGMEGMARQGRRAEDILAYYYPTSMLTRMY